MKNPIIKQIENILAMHKAEVKKYEAMLKAYGSATTSEEIVPSIIEKARGQKSGVKRGPYKPRKKKKTAEIKLSFRKSIESPDWNVEIPKVLKASGQALTTREIIDIIHPGSYSKTKRVLHGRCGAIIAIYKKQHKVVKEAGMKEGFQSYMVL